jgi:hypothetical protein
MKSRRSRRVAGVSLSLAAMAVCAAPLLPVASAAVIPPGNSAANQYTEAFPTTGGSTPTGGKGHTTPAKALGAKNAKRLEAQGAEGRAAAEVAAATAPVVRPGGSSPARGSSLLHGTARSGTQPTTSAGQSSTRVSGHPPRGSSGASGGSSGVGEVLAQATGSSSSGRLGLFLPLLIAAAIVWSVAYAFRRRRRTG